MFIFQKCSAVGVVSVFLNLNRQHVTPGSPPHEVQKAEREIEKAEIHIFTRFYDF
jgi:hypothetical protein